MLCRRKGAAAAAGEQQWLLQAAAAASSLDMKQGSGKDVGPEAASLQMLNVKQQRMRQAGSAVV